MKPIYVILTMPEYREEFREICELKNIKIQDSRFLALPKSTYAIVRVNGNVVDDWMTAWGSSDLHKLVPPESIMLGLVDYKSFLESLPKNLISSQNTKKHMYNYFHCAVISTSSEGEVTEIVKFKTVLAESRQELEREIIRDIPKETKLKDCEILIQEVFQ